MANTYTQLYIQFVFSVKERKRVIDESFRVDLEKYICGIIRDQNCKTYCIYCNPDHIHLLVSMHPNISPSKLMEQVKSGSSNWLNERRYISGKFNWQNGFGAFTYSRTQIDSVVKYILNQPVHHKKILFEDEYLLLLQEFGLEYDEKYLF